jgi:hypothetical protein
MAEPGKNDNREPPVILKLSFSFWKPISKTSKIASARKMTCRTFSKIEPDLTGRSFQAEL